MKRAPRTLLILLVVLVVAGGVVAFVLNGGLSPARTGVRGTLVHDGKPVLPPSETHKVLLIFVPEKVGKDFEVYRAEVDRTTGEFTLPALPSGRYVVAVQLFDDKHMDSFGGKYDPGKSPLRYDVTEDNQVIEVVVPKEETEEPKEPRPKGKGKKGFTV